MILSEEIGNYVTAKLDGVNTTSIILLACTEVDNEVNYTIVIKAPKGKHQLVDLLKQAKQHPDVGSTMKSVIMANTLS